MQLKLSHPVESISGSSRDQFLDGAKLVYYVRNGQQCARAKVNPAQPQSTRQQLVRDIFGELSTKWYNTLTNAQRAAWRTFAESFPLRPGLNPSSSYALNWYQKLNFLLSLSNSALITLPPDSPSPIVYPTVSAPVTYDGLVDPSHYLFVGTAVDVTYIKLMLEMTPIMPRSVQPRSNDYRMVQWFGGGWCVSLSTTIDEQILAIQAPDALSDRVYYRGTLFDSFGRNCGAIGGNVTITSVPAA